jgi:hypothetical protein
MMAAALAVGKVEWEAREAAEAGAGEGEGEEGP